MKSSELLFFNSFKFKISTSITNAVFFYLFFIFFLPFGVDNYDPNHSYTIQFLSEFLYFFFTVLGVSAFIEFAIKPMFIKDFNRLTIVLWTLWSMWIVTSSLFIVYNWLGNWHDFNWPSYFEFLIQVPVVLVFPSLGTFFFFRYQSLQNKVEEFLTLNKESLDSNQLITFNGDGVHDEITILLSDFLYAKAQDNYVELHYKEEQEIKKFLIRSTIQKLAKDLSKTSIIRCHRSFLVNLLNVTSILHSSGSILLRLGSFHTTIRVSKSYKEKVLDKLSLLKN